MNEERQPPVPSLPTYTNPNTFVDPKQQAPMMKMMGKMLGKRLPRLMKNPKIHSQSISIKHKKKVTYW